MSRRISRGVRQDGIRGLFAEAPVEKTTLRLTAATLEAANQRARDCGLSFNSWVTHVIDNELKHPGGSR